MADVSKQRSSALHHHGDSIMTPNKKEPQPLATEIMPVGVLAVHIKRCKNIKLLDASAKAFSKRLPVNLYVKIIIGEGSKLTSICDVKCSNNAVAIFDDMKHILLHIHNKIDDDSNKVKMILVGYQGGEKHKKLGEKEIHLFNIIKNLFLIENLELTHNAHVIGEIELEMAFSYGCFGYGYSSQLEGKTSTPEDQISQSMFYRAEPPVDRRHDTKDVMTCIPTPHPSFIKWPTKVEIGMSGREYMTESITDLLQGKDKKMSDNFPLLTSKLNVSMPELQRKFAALNKRSQRIAFLQNLISTKINPELEENQDEILFGKDKTWDRKEDEGREQNAEAEDIENDNGVFYRITNFFKGVFNKKSASLGGGKEPILEKTGNVKQETENQSHAEDTLPAVVPTFNFTEFELASSPNNLTDEFKNARSS